MSQEHRDASLEVIGVSAGILVFLVLCGIGTSLWMYYAHNHGPGTPVTAGRQTSFHNGPEQQVSVLRDYAKVIKATDEHLDHYAWLDRKAGIARIPIERAMALTAAGVKPAPAPQVPAQVP